MFYKKLLSPRIWKRIVVERFSEPLHLNFLSIFVFIFGTMRQKIFFDLILRHHNAYSVLSCAEQAKKMGLSGVSIIEFGVASGAGFLNLAYLAERISKIVGISIHVYGFDTGVGLPKPDGYKDLSAGLKKGDYVMDIDALKKKCPDHATLILGDVKETVPQFINSFSGELPIGYIVQDLDFYTSTANALDVLLDPNPEKYLPVIHMYLDDIDFFGHSTFCGEELACSEFNASNQHRKIEKNVFLKYSRVFKQAKWLEKMMKVQIFDHPVHSPDTSRSPSKQLSNPYLS